MENNWNYGLLPVEMERTKIANSPALKFSVIFEVIEPDYTSDAIDGAQVAINRINNNLRNALGVRKLLNELHLAKENIDKDVQKAVSAIEKVISKLEKLNILYIQSERK